MVYQIIWTEEAEGDFYAIIHYLREFFTEITPEAINKIMKNW